MASSERCDVLLDISAPSQALSLMVDRSHTSSGLILTDLHYKPIYANDAARHILDYVPGPRCASERDVFLQEELRQVLHATEYTADAVPLRVFVSGRRRYVCRSFLLDGHNGRGPSPLVALLIERCAQQHGDLQEASRRFRLSPRECETVVHLTHGLTTKEIAHCMNVSPNTVKQFVRLIMSKMNVTTRSGILGKLLAS